MGNKKKTHGTIVIKDHELYYPKFPLRGYKNRYDSVSTIGTDGMEWTITVTLMNSHGHGDGWAMMDGG